MKKLIILIILIAIIAGGGFAYSKMSVKECYVKIEQNGKQQLENTPDGPVKRYIYNLKAYDEKGNEVPVEFYTDKNLRLNAYLCVKVMKPVNNTKNKIKTYEEVTAQKLPEKVKQKLNVK
ncbi:YxeA family protein [Clostridium botulinum]|nr:YxeA family protein [Clostridium botulinum]